MSTVYRSALIYKNLNPLTIPSISISRKGKAPTCTTKLPGDLLKRVGLGLQKMLQHEYGDAYQSTMAWADSKM
jgi:hypothetical protein